VTFQTVDLSADVLRHGLAYLFSRGLLFLDAEIFTPESNQTRETRQNFVGVQQA
jgi:hypothetical protein